jgi:signal transduction histidine kinase
VLARAQSGVEPPRLEFFPLEPKLEEVAAGVSTAAGVELVVDCPPRLAALADADLLQEALAALVENAALHTARGTIALRARSYDDRHLELEIQDSGDGILPELQEQLFEPFARGPAGGNGFGLGLAIAREAVAAMGSTLAVESQPQRGTRFSFRLPSAEVVS